jgi:hypothetical protein
LPAASKPPITYSFPPEVAAAASSSAIGKDRSMRCFGGEGDGELVAIVGLGEGKSEAVGE